MVFITWSGKKSGVDRGTPTRPMRICDCGAPGLSTRYTVRAAGGGGVESVTRGAAGRSRVQLPKLGLEQRHGRDRA